MQTIDCRPATCAMRLQNIAARNSKPEIGGALPHIAGDYIPSG